MQHYLSFNLRRSCRLIGLIFSTVFLICFHVQAAEVNRTQAETDYENILNGIRTDITQVKADLVTSRKLVKKDIDRQMKKIEKEEARISERIRQLKTSSGSAWKDLQTGLDSSLNELSKSVKKAKQRFDDVPKEPSK